MVVQVESWHGHLLRSPFLPCLPQLSKREVTKFVFEADRKQQTFSLLRDENRCPASFQLHVSTRLQASSVLHQHQAVGVIALLTHAQVCVGSRYTQRSPLER